MVGITFIFKLPANTIWLICTVLSSWRNYSKLNLCSDRIVKSMQGHKLRWYGAVNGVKSTNYLQLLLLTALIRNASIWKSGYVHSHPGHLVCSITLFFCWIPSSSSEAKALKCLVSPCCVCVCNSWTRAIGYVRLKVDGPVLLPGKLPPSQSPYSKCCKLVRCSIAPLSLISCMT